MPPNNSAPRADPPTPQPPGAERRLRGVTGGYDLDAWPIHVPRRDGEALQGWLLRLAHRYGVNVRHVFVELGADPPPQGRIDVSTLLASHRDAATRLLGAPAAAQQLRTSAFGVALERLDHHFWRDYRNYHTPRWRPASRFCPTCLEETGTWAETWQHPYHLACLTHAVLLDQACPCCDAKPFERRTWMTHTDGVTTCHGFTDLHEGRYRSRCAAPLHQVRPTPAPPGLIAAQRWLFDIVQSSTTGADVSMLGMSIDPVTAYNAAGDIITENAHTDDPLTTAAEVHGLLCAHRVLTAKSVPDAAHAWNALHLNGLDPEHGLAPMTSQFTAARRPRNPVLAAVGFQTRHGRLTFGAELRFRIGSQAPCYPHAWHVKSAPLTAFAKLPELPMASIPATVWDGALTLDDDPDDTLGIRTPTGRAFVAIALARYGSDRPWRLLAVNLGLPAHAASLGARHWHAIDRAGRWPDYLRAVSDLFQLLHDSPPPIDYERRRITAQPARVTTAAGKLHGRDPHGTPGRAALARALWSTYTGTHVSFAPSQLRPHVRDDPDDAPDDQLILRGADLLQQGLRPHHEEPLAWQPP